MILRGLNNTARTIEALKWSWQQLLACTKTQFGRSSTGWGRPRLESLEERIVPTQVIQPQFGPETIVWAGGGNPPGQTGNAKDFGYPVVNLPYSNNPDAIKSPKIYLIFWGPDWGSNGQLGPVAQAMLTDTQTILASSFFNGLTQYGSDGKAFFGGVYLDSTPYPRDAKGVPAPDDTSELARLLGLPNSPLPQPTGSPTQSPPIYAFVRESVFSYDGGGSNNYYKVPNTSFHANFIDIAPTGINQPPAMSDVGNFDRIISHEIAERMFTGVQGTGDGNLWQLVSTTFQKYFGGLGSTPGLEQISDDEPDGNYLLHLGANISLPYVQAYYSSLDRAFIVPDGNSLPFLLTPVWTINGPATVDAKGNVISHVSFSGHSDLTLNLKVGDTVVIDVAPGGPIDVTWDGHLDAFDFNSIDHVYVHFASGGHQTVNIPELASTLAVNVTTPAGSTSNSTDSVNIGTDGQTQLSGVGNGDFSNVLGSIIVNATNVTATVTDNGDSTNQAIKMFSTGGTDFLTWGSGGLLEFGNATFAALTILGGIGANTIDFETTATNGAITLNTGSGIDQVYIDSSSGPGLFAVTSTAPPGQGQTTVILGIPPGGATGLLSRIGRPVTVSSSGAVMNVVLDDSGDQGPQNFLFTDLSVSHGSLQAPASRS